MILDAADRDPSVDPGTDFYRFANGGWIDANPIPSGYGAWGAFEEVGIRNEAILHDLLQAAADHPTNELERMLGDAYAAGMDLAAIEAAGLAPIQPFVDQAYAVVDHADVASLLPGFHRSGFVLLFGVAVTVDHDDSTRNLLWLVPTGLGLPDRDAYFDESGAAAGLRAAYVDHVAAQLVNLGTAAEVAARQAPKILDFETRLATQHLRGEERRDPGRTLNRHDLDELRALSPSLDLVGYLRAIGAGHVGSVNVQQPVFFAALHEIITATDIETLRAYLAFHVVATRAGSLSPTYDEESFSFYGRRIEGKQQQQERFKRVVAAITADMGEALGQRYVATAFPPAAKERAVNLVGAIRREMRHSLETRSWMSDETRQLGLEKLGALRVKIGYPDEWRDWAGLTVRRASYAENRIEAARFEFDYQLAQLDQPVDPTDWEMPPQAVNAYYHPTRNEIVFPAGILQPPMFDAEADDAVNFGGIGTVIAHEITHGFDDQGRRFDAAGAFRDWWTADDERSFTGLADRLAAQFDQYIVIDDVHVNGRLTLGENIADLGGISLAQRAHARLAAGAPSIDGLTPAQRFFLANAALWRATISEELQRTLAQVDVHSPRQLRVRGPLANLDAFQEAFGLADDAPMLRPRDERIQIW